jgi:MarR family transcriptional regulator, organic hydroperoxide resistance regulator
MSGGRSQDVSEHGAQPPAGPFLARDVEPEIEAILGDFLAIVRLQRQVLFRVFARHGLHPGQAMCLRVLERCPEEIGQSALADMLMLSRPSVTRLLQRMERAGLVVRRTGSTDQRQTLVSLTSQGRELGQRFERAMTEYTTSTISRLEPEDRADLARVLRVWRGLAEESAA